jgi:hypothetical protein
MSGHTPGPWKYDDWSEGINSKNGWVCHIPQDDCADYKADGELEANARLITSAPEMLEVLEELVHQIWVYECVVDFDEDDPDFPEAVEKAKKLILRIRGE